MTRKIAVSPLFNTYHGQYAPAVYGSPGFPEAPPTRRTQRKSLMEFTKERLKKKMEKFKKCQFFLILAICTSILLFQTAQCVDKYFKKATGTADKYVHISKTSFPVMTICPTYPYKLDRLKYHGIETKSKIQFGAHWVSNDSSIGPKEFYEDVVMTVDEIVKGVGIWAERVIEGSNQFQLAPGDTICGQKLFSVAPYYFNGDCFPLEMPECLWQAGVLELVLDFYDKTDIFIHHPGQFLSPNSRSRVDVDKGKFVKIAVNHEVVQLLGDDGTCVADYGEHSHDYDSCMYEKLTNLTLTELRCTVPWIRDKSKICTNATDRVRAFEIYQENRRNQHNICPSSCLFTNMYFGPPVTGEQNKELSHFARGVFYFRRDIKTTTEYYLYSGLSMVAEIGGYVGLLLGVSLFKLASVNNLFLDWFYGNRIADMEEDETKKRQLRRPRFLNDVTKTHFNF